VLSSQHIHAGRALYPHGDHRRDRGFSIFISASTLGLFFASCLRYSGRGVRDGITGSVLQASHAGRACHLPDGPEAPCAEYLSARTRGAISRHEPLSPDDRNKILGLVALMLFHHHFLGVYEQQGNTLALWADANTDRHILGWEMPASWFQAFKSGYDHPFYTGYHQLLVMAGKARQGTFQRRQDGYRMHVARRLIYRHGYCRTYLPGTATSQHLVAYNLYSRLHRRRNCNLSPVALSLVTKLAPVRMVSMLMGMWFLSNFAGNYLAGYLGTFWERMPKQTFFIMLSLLSWAREWVCSRC